MLTENTLRREIGLFVEFEIDLPFDRFPAHLINSVVMMGIVQLKANVTLIEDGERSKITVGPIAFAKDRKELLRRVREGGISLSVDPGHR